MKIMLPHGEQKRLAADFKVSRISLWRALTGQTDSKLARTLRRVAIERGGVVFEPDRNAKSR